MAGMNIYFNNTWISIKEKLPPTGRDKNYPKCSDTVLFSDGKKVVAGQCEYVDGEKYFITERGEELEIKVEYWQPLPPPPSNP